MWSSKYQAGAPPQSLISADNDSYSPATSPHELHFASLLSPSTNGCKVILLHLGLTDAQTSSNYPRYVYLEFSKAHRCTTRRLANLPRAFFGRNRGLRKVEGAVMLLQAFWRLHFRHVQHQLMLGIELRAILIYSHANRATRFCPFTPIFCGAHRPVRLHFKVLPPSRSF